MAEQIDFYQIYWDPVQRKDCFDFSIKYHNTSLTPYFENSIISSIVNQSVSDKIAVCSWSLRQKMTMRIPPRRELTEEALHEDFEILSFTKNAPDHDMLGALEGWHPGSKEILRKIWSKLGLNMVNRPENPIYQNAFCAKSSIYKAYVKEFLDPAMKLMAEDDEIRNLCFQNSNYTRTTLNKPVDFDRIKRLLGIPWYPLHPFLLERCFSLWIHGKFKVTYL